jgi:hypothetical protein
MIPRPYSMVTIKDPRDLNRTIKSVEGPHVHHRTVEKFCGPEPTEERLAELAVTLNAVYAVGVEHARDAVRESLGILTTNFGEFKHKR